MSGWRNQVDVLFYSFSPTVRIHTEPNHGGLHFPASVVHPPPSPRYHRVTKTHPPVTEQVLGIRGMGGWKAKNESRPSGSGSEQKPLVPAVRESQAGAGIGFNPEGLPQGRGPLGVDSVMAGACKPEHEGGGAGPPRTAEKTLGSDLALAQHFLGLPAHPPVALLRPRGWKGTFLLP